MAGRVQYDGIFYHNDDASFRAWGLEFKTKLATVLGAGSMVQTADTGQINWTTALRATVGVDAGYEIYRFDDALQATAPVFIKITYGTHTTTTWPRIGITIGGATNGAGNITTTSPVGSLLMNEGMPGIGPQFAAFPSYICVQPGYFGVLLAGGCFSVASGTAWTWWSVERPRDNTGAMVGEGVTLMTKGLINSIHYYLRWAHPRGAITSGGSACVVPGNVTYSQAGNTIQVFRHFVQPSVTVRNLIGTEISLGTVFPMALVAGESHDYLATSTWGSQTSSSANTAHAVALRYDA
jgi:hypothetical protein